MHMHNAHVHIQVHTLIHSHTNVHSHDRLDAESLSSGFYLSDAVSLSVMLLCLQPVDEESSRRNNTQNENQSG